MPLRKIADGREELGQELIIACLQLCQDIRSHFPDIVFLVRLYDGMKEAQVKRKEEGAPGPTFSGNLKSYA